MNSKKNSLLILVVFLLGCTLPISMIAMLSKPQHTKEEKEYTQQEMARQEKLDKDLLYACLDKQINKVYVLLEKGADPNTRDEEGIPLLNIMTALGRLDFIKVLVANGADVNSKDAQGTTPLHITAQENLSDIMRYLLDSGAAINAQNTNEATPLWFACVLENVLLAQLLLNEGADPEIGPPGLIPLFSACIANKTDQIVKLLIQNKAKVNVYGPGGITPLHLACKKGKVNIAKVLLDAGADYNAECYGVTPVEIACDKNNNTMIALFNTYGVLTKSQQEADKAMHIFFAELNQERQQKIKKVVVQQQKKQVKKIEQKKEIDTKKEIEELKLRESSIGEMGPEELSEVQPAEQFLVTSSITPSSTSTTSTITTTPMISTSPSVGSKSEISKKSPPQISASQDNVYLVVEGKQLKWPRSLRQNQEKLIEDNISALKNWPNHGLSDVKKMEKTLNTFRLRVGGYRIIFSVNNSRREIKIEHIGLRKNIYK
jgi:ankyrin repeat protein/mRNA-degrading endonuclease RelE of RelBE toxin-antitoxin system